MSSFKSGRSCLILDNVGILISDFQGSCSIQSCFPSRMSYKYLTYVAPKLYQYIDITITTYILISDGAMAMTGSALVGGVLLAVIEGVGIIMNRMAASNMQNSKFILNYRKQITSSFVFEFHHTVSDST